MSLSNLTKDEEKYINNFYSSTSIQKQIEKVNIEVFDDDNKKKFDESFYTNKLQDNILQDNILQDNILQDNNRK